MHGARGGEWLLLGAVTMAHVPERESWGLVVRDSEGRDRFPVGQAGNGGSGLAVWDGDGTIRIGLGGGAPDTGVGLALRDAAGTERAAMGIGPGVGGGDFALKGLDGQDIWRASRYKGAAPAGQ